MSSMCKYWGKVELSFDNAYKSKTCKMIPLDKTSGLPHQCNENPYSQKQPQSQQSAINASKLEKISISPTNSAQQQSQPQQQQNKDYGISEESVQRGIDAFTMVTNPTILAEQTQKYLVILDNKIDRLTKLVYAQSQQQKERDDNFSKDRHMPA